MGCQQSQGKDSAQFPVVAVAELVVLVTEEAGEEETTVLIWLTTSSERQEAGAFYLAPIPLAPSLTTPQPEV